MGESMNTDLQLPQLIHHVVDHVKSVEGIVAIALGGSRQGAPIPLRQMWIWGFILNQRTHLISLP